MAALLILLIALGALAAGVLVGPYYVPDDRALKRRARHAQHYLRALTHHIARDHDTVVAELRKVVDDNVDDHEPYFALAALFRGRGEHERAVRVHQALAVREGASTRLRQRALYELGLDFRTAGMPRRAVKALETVLADDSGHEGALRALCGLYEEQGRFAEAAGAWARLGKVRGEPPPKRHHHLVCAAAQQAVAAGDLDSAKQLLREAKSQPSPHFFVAAAELAAARGNARGARERLCQALEAAPELTVYLGPGLVAAEAKLLGGAAPTSEAVDDLDDGAPATALAVATSDGARATATTLAELAERTGSPHLALAAAVALAPIDGAASTARLAIIEQAAPAYLPARLVAARTALGGDDPAPVRRELAALVEALAWADGNAWRCRHCGQRGDRFAWRCGGCRRWATAAPELGRDRTQAALPPPRERRAERRTTTTALLGERADLSLPSGAVEHGLTGAELTARAERRSLLGRVGGWLSGAWPGRKKT